MSMLINEVSKRTNLTKKAIEYYTEQNLITPVILDNGYRDFSEMDVECLEKVAVLRKLRLNTSEIKAVFADETGNALKNISVQNELNMQRWQTKKIILDKLSNGTSYSVISAELKGIEQSATITEKLLELFPGYYGRFICLHFAQFLNEPIASEEQCFAFAEVIDFLDNMPSLQFPEHLQAFLDETTKGFSIENFNMMMANTHQSIDNPDMFISKNREQLEQYMAFKKSNEYKNSPLSIIKTMIRDFNNANGYYDIFIPAMRRLSKPYAEYLAQLEVANARLLEQYPEIEQFE